MAEIQRKSDQRALSSCAQRAVRYAPCALLMLAFIILATFLGVYASALASDGWFRGSLDELVPLATVGIVIPAAIIVPLLAKALRRISRPPAPAPKARLPSASPPPSIASCSPGASAPSSSRRSSSCSAGRFGSSRSIRAR